MSSPTLLCICPSSPSRLLAGPASARSSSSRPYRKWPARSREIVDALLAAKKNVCYLEIDAPQGHDAFLMPIPRYLQAFGAYMKRIEV